MDLFIGHAVVGEPQSATAKCGIVFVSDAVGAVRRVTALICAASCAGQEIGPCLSCKRVTSFITGATDKKCCLAVHTLQLTPTQHPQEPGHTPRDYIYEQGEAQGEAH